MLQVLAVIKVPLYCTRRVPFAKFFRALRLKKKRNPGEGAPKLEAEIELNLCSEWCLHRIGNGVFSRCRLARYLGF